MNYSEPLLRQLTDALSFVGVGFLLGVLYTVCGFFRRLSGGGKKATFALDLLFCFLSFACLFGASLALQNGVWRLPSLLAAGADVSAQDKAGRTALAIAKEYGNAAVVALLSAQNTGKR